MYDTDTKETVYKSTQGGMVVDLTDMLFQFSVLLGDKMKTTKYEISSIECDKRGITCTLELSMGGVPVDTVVGMYSKTDRVLICNGDRNKCFMYEHMVIL